MNVVIRHSAFGIGEQNKYIRILTINSFHETSITRPQNKTKFNIALATCRVTHLKGSIDASDGLGRRDGHTRVHGCPIFGDITGRFDRYAIFGDGIAKGGRVRALDFAGTDHSDHVLDVLRIGAHRREGDDAKKEGGVGADDEIHCKRGCRGKGSR